MHEPPRGEFSRARTQSRLSRRHVSSSSITHTHTYTRTHMYRLKGREGGGFPYRNTFIAKSSDMKREAMRCDAMKVRRRVGGRGRGRDIAAHRLFRCACVCVKRIRGGLTQTAAAREVLYEGELSAADTVASSSSLALALPPQHPGRLRCRRGSLRGMLMVHAVRRQQNSST